MASSTATDDESLSQDLNCSICLDLFNEPVTLTGCFHSFCKNCLEQTISGARDSYRHPYTCPQCRQRFSPSELDRINQHLQSIVESHKREQERRALVRRNRSESRTSNVDVERLRTVLSTADAFVQSLVTLMDQASLRAARGQRRVSLESVDTFGSAPYQSRHQYREARRHPRVPRTQATAPLLSIPSDSESESDSYSEDVSISVSEVEVEQRPDCEFEAETPQQYFARSVALFRRHFVLIMFLIHVSIFVVCLFHAMV